MYNDTEKALLPCPVLVLFLIFSGNRSIDLFSPPRQFSWATLIQFLNPFMATERGTQYFIQSIMTPFSGSLSICSWTSSALLLSLLFSLFGEIVCPIKTVKLKNKGSSKCLDSNLQGEVYAIPCNGGDHQEWIPDDKRKTYTNYRTGRCLDSNGKTVYTTGCNGGEYQMWRNFPKLENEATNLCLEGNDYSKDVSISTCNHDWNGQVWGDEPIKSEEELTAKEEL